MSDSVVIIACGQMHTMRDVLIHHTSVSSVDHIIFVYIVSQKKTSHLLFHHCALPSALIGLFGACLQISYF